MASAKREVTHRELFEQVGRLQGAMRERYKYDLKRYKAEDAYRKRMLEKVTAVEASVKKLDGIPERLAVLETSKKNFDAMKLMGMGSLKTLRWLGIGALIVVACAVLGIKQGVAFLFGLFHWGT